MISTTITGIDGLTRSMAALADELKRKTLHDALQLGARPLYNAMVDAAPVGVRDSRGNKLASRNHVKGNLKKSIRILRGSGEDYPTYWVKPVKGKGDPDGWYAKFVEYGHMTRVGSFGKKGRIGKNEGARMVRPKGFGFIRKTYESMDGTVKGIISEKIMGDVLKYVQQ